MNEQLQNNHKLAQMDVEAALKIVDRAVFAKNKRRLKHVERVVFKGAWLRQSYAEIAKESGYTLTYIRQDIGSKLWKLLSEVLAEPVSKINLQAAVEREWERQRLLNEKPTEEKISPQDSQSEEVLPEPERKPILSHNPYFIGRNRELADLNAFVQQGAKIILVYGKGGVGKSWLSWEYFTSKGFDLILELWMAKETEKITNAKSIVEEWLRRHFQEEPRGDFGVTLELLRQKLRDPNRRVGVLIDNLEPALDKHGRLIPAHRDYVELFRVLADPAGNCVTLITSRERLGESAVTFQDYRLEGLEISVWQQFFRNRGIEAHSGVLLAMHQAYGGNAKAMQILSGVIQADWSGDLESYWQANQKNLLIESDLQDLVVSQFKRLQEVDADAYRLLCRLGCFRYQDVRAVQRDAMMCLLWDVPESQRIRVVKSLRDRSLVDFLKGEYWLHPVIRAEARTRLKASEDWKTANLKAAEFWTQSVETVDTTADAIAALEAYYHYVDIGEFELGCQVLLQERKYKLNSHGEPESLIIYFGRLGLVQHILSVSIAIKNKIDNDYFLTYLYGNIAGLYHQLGDIQTAIEYYQKANSMATKYSDSLPKDSIDPKIKYRLEKFSIGMLFTTSSCKEALWEVEAAIKSYKEVIALAENTNWHIFAIFSQFSMALLYSHSQLETEQKKALELIDKNYQAYLTLPERMLGAWSHVYSYFSMGMSYTNLGRNEQALTMFNRALTYAENSNYVRAIGQIITGLAMVSRNQGKYEEAVEQHTKAIGILHRITAKKDLADAYYELARTNQKIGDIEKSHSNFQAAIQIYEQMGAPKQVQKIQKAMENLPVTSH
ncbi:tetratricopeptide repeat protein [Phormidium sp. LEGE 05292]|uniref:tetratricopeptide repeat protein n=1 Tax=[Phormidium] sp. LEGE 05292 TaxID=767427 RepID=UPI001881C7DB|nr:tetratricopeptide repeat protein [Phormidium sp. LEGE 05292]MBE9226105.1 tetratricopeptide repeat protein [Phormidium sp. LEGE 05292]